MHFSSIIITNTGWLLDKPRERARAKKKTHSRLRDRLYLSISSRRKLSRVSSLSCRASREDDVNPDASVAHTHKREYTQHGGDSREFGQTRVELGEHASTIFHDAPNFCICIPGVVRNLLSIYRYYTYAWGYVCICIYVYIHIYVSMSVCVCYKCTMKD